MTRLSVLFCVIFGTVSLIQGFVLEEFFPFPDRRNLSGNFTVTPRDGAVCRWYEQGSGRATQIRYLIIRCRVENRFNYECTYRGNPHMCRWYNQGHQETFYRGLAKEAATNQTTACSKESLVNENCLDVTFKKEPSQFFLSSF